MKQILLILMLVSVVSGAKYTIIGNSIAVVDTVWKTFVAAKGDGSTYNNRSVGGYGMEDFDCVVSVYKDKIDEILKSDDPDYLLSDLGINNYAIDIGILTYMSIPQEFAFLNKVNRMCIDRGVEFIVSEVLPAWSSACASDAGREFMLRRIDSSNAAKREWCANNNVKMVRCHDTFALANGHPNPIYFNADLVHPNTAGSILLGNLWASASVPTNPNTYKKMAATANGRLIKGINTVDLSKITDSSFWANCNGSGSNINLTLNGVQKSRYIDDYDKQNKKGIIRFIHNASDTTKLVLTTTNNVYTNTLQIDTTNVLAFYKMNDHESDPITIREYANNNPATVTLSADVWTYFTQYIDIPKNNVFKYLHEGGNNGLRASNSFLSGRKKFTIDTWVWFYDTTIFYGSATRLLFCSGTSVATQMGVFFNNTNGILIWVNTGTVTWSSTSIKQYLTQRIWHKLSISFDLDESSNSDKVKVFVDTNRVTSNITTTGTYPSTFPTQNGNMFLAGWFSSGAFWPTYIAMHSYKINNYAMTQIDAISDYKLQNSAFTVTTLPSTSTTGSRWSAYKQAYKSAYKKTWK